MDIAKSQKILDNVYYFSLNDLDPQRSELVIDPPVSSHYLYFIVPFRDVHSLAVQISIIPFCLPEHYGQTFYYAHGSYGRCCSSIEPREFLSTVSDASKEIYTRYVRHHHWDFGSPCSWEPLQLIHDAFPASDSCSEVPVLYLQVLIKEASEIVATDPLLAHDISSPHLRHLQGSTPSAHHLHSSVNFPMRNDRARRSANETRPPRRSSLTTTSPHGPPERTATQIADDFLDCLVNFNESTIDVRSYCSPLNISHTSDIEPEQSASDAAWKLCTTVAKRAKEHFQYAYFTRYVSLCFFLIWETFSSKAGKAGAREVNAKMKEAGFEGTSRTLKSLRDETVFINRLIASAQCMYGDELSSKLLYCIFESSNYRFIRSINRFSESKKLSAVKYICSKMDLALSMQQPTSIIQIQDILREYLPSLSVDAINMAIRHEPFETRNRLDSNASSLYVSWDDTLGEDRMIETDGPRNSGEGPSQSASPSVRTVASSAGDNSTQATMDVEMSQYSVGGCVQSPGHDAQDLVFDSPFTKLAEDLDCWDLDYWFKNCDG